MKIVYDATLCRPGCVLIQAAFGGDLKLADRFPTESWLVSPTPDMRLYEVTEEQVPLLVAKTEEAMQ